jgi:hypothetical protein
MQFHKPMAVATTVAAICAGGAVLAQQPPPISAQSAAQKLMAVPGSKYPGRMHVLPATMETTQWGWFDNAELPRLIIDSGDTVAIESMSHSHGPALSGTHHRGAEEIAHRLAGARADDADRPDLRQRCGARRHAADQDSEDRPAAVGRELSTCPDCSDNSRAAFPKDR